MIPEGVCPNVVGRQGNKPGIRKSTTQFIGIQEVGRKNRKWGHVVKHVTICPEWSFSSRFHYLLKAVPSSADQVFKHKELEAQFSG